MPGEDPPVIQIESTLTCPRCGYQSAEQMPTDACRFFYTCKGCGETDDQNRIWIKPELDAL